MDIIFTPIIIIALIAGFYMAWNIGANDLANSMGTSVGSRALTIRRAIIVAVVHEFCGAVLAGSHVTDTVRKKIVDVNLLSSVSGGADIFMYGMLAAILGAAIWLTIATYLRLPVSTTHSIVGAVIGFGLIALGFAALNTGKLMQTVASWFVSPIFGGILAFITFMVIRKLIFDMDNKLESAKRVAPFLVGIVFVILSLSMVYKGLKNLHLDFAFQEAFLIALAVGCLAGIITHILLRNYKPKTTDEYQQVENFFKYLQILTACYVAFAHGANDVANAIAPLSAIISVAQTGDILQKSPVPIYILILGGI